MRFETQFQLDRCVSPDLTRAAINHAHLDVANNRMVATNGAMLASIPVTVEDGDSPGPISTEALKAARKVAGKRDGAYIRANGALAVKDGPTFPRPDVGQFLPYEQLIPAYKAGDPGTITVGLDARYLLALATALGAVDKLDGIVSLTIRLPPVKSVTEGIDVSCLDTLAENLSVGAMLDPIVVKSPDHPDAVGVLMPARVYTGQSRPNPRTKRQSQ